MTPSTGCCGSQRSPPFCFVRPHNGGKGAKIIYTIVLRVAPKHGPCLNSIHFFSVDAADESIDFWHNISRHLLYWLALIHLHYIFICKGQGGGRPMELWNCMHGPTAQTHTAENLTYMHPNTIKRVPRAEQFAYIYLRMEPSLNGRCMYNLLFWFKLKCRTSPRWTRWLYNAMGVG